MVFAAVAVLFLTVISAASVRYFLEIRRICGGMVAENSATCLSSGVSARIVSTSSAKPILSISSASSRTRKRSSDRSRVPFSRWSMIRPGVPTTTWTPRRSAESWTPYPWPPYTGSTWTPGRWAAYRSNASETCSASSRVGASTSACGFFCLQVELGQDRHRERRGLAGAGLRQPDDVAALEQRRDRGGLDRRRRLVADVVQGPQHPLVDAQVGEGRRLVGLGVRRADVRGGHRPRVVRDADLPAVAVVRRRLRRRRRCGVAAPLTPPATAVPAPAAALLPPSGTP